MKTIRKITAFFLTGAMLFGMSATVAGAQTTGGSLSFKPAKNTGTVITYKSGKQTTYDGVLDTAASENNGALGGVASYEVRCAGKTAVSVTLNDIKSDNSVSAGTSQLNGYYAADFDVEGNQSAFVTGLSPSNIQKLQTELVDCYINNKEVKIEDISFIDAEKTGIKGEDSLMCWAAACSNMLTYTGWAGAAGFEDEDALMEKFIECYNDDGNNYDYAMAWFFNGVTGVSNEQYGYGAMPEEDTGGYFNDYAYDKVCQSYDVVTDGDPTGFMRQLKSDLRAGNGIMLGISGFNEEYGVYGGHALSCWGYVVDNDYADTQKEHYKMLIFTDSDSDYTGELDRRTAPNTMNAFTLEPFYFEDDYGYYKVVMDTWRCVGYGEFIISRFASLFPCNDATEKETSPKATKSKAETVDFVAHSVFAGQENDDNGANYIPYDCDVWIGGLWTNMSEQVFYGNVDVRLTVTDEGGAQIFDRTFTEKDCELQLYEYGFESSRVNIGKLNVGAYKLTIQVNPNEKVREAYYYNNTYSETFRVIEPSIDRSKLKLTLGEPSAFGEYAKYPVSVDGLSQQELDSVTGYELNYKHFGETGEGIWLTLDDYCIFSDGEALPDACMFDNQEKTQLMIKLKFKDQPSVYLYTDEFTPDLPQISVYSQTDERFSEEGFTDVEENATAFADGEELKYTLENTSSENHGSVSGTYYVLAETDRGVKVKLVEPVSFTLKPGETLSVKVTQFDNPLPNGNYIIKLIVEGGAVANHPEFFYEPYIKAGIGDQYYRIGDVNRDGKININDATMIQKYLAHLVRFDDYQRDVLADVDMNGKVTINDATVIQKLINL